MICKIFFLCFVGSLEPRHVCSTFILPPNGLGNMYFREVLCWYIRPDKPGTPSSRVSQILSMFCLSCQLYCLGSIISEVQLTQGWCMLSQLWQLTVVSSYVPSPCCAQGPCVFAVRRLPPLALTVIPAPLQQLFLSFRRRQCDSDVLFKG